MSLRRGMGLGIGVVVLVVAFWQLQPATAGVSETSLGSQPPVTLMHSRIEPPPGAPLVLIGHGFAGSRVIMHGFAMTLARAGYRVVLWDFAGHGSNPAPLPATTGPWSLIDEAETAWALAKEQGLAEAGRVAILGHSMGSGVALAFGQAYPETAATIAVSPTAQAVSPELPRNLLLLAGSLEPRFVRNAEVRLAEAGGAGGDPADGTGRRLEIIPGVEHISILFSPAAHRAARQWVDATFGSQAGAAPYTDRRIVWYGVGVVGALLAGWALGPRTARPSPAGRSVGSAWRRGAALVVGALVATVVLWVLGLAGLQVRSVGGLLVGGYLCLWFGVAGAVSWLLLGVGPARPQPRAWAGALVAFGVLWVGVGLLAQFVWLPWLLIPQRLALWPFAALLLLPWFLAMGSVMAGSNGWGRWGWYLVGTAGLLAGMVLALRLHPELGFLVLILPLFPVILALHLAAALPHRGPWPYAVSGALFTSWLVLAVFPLQ
jgi:dienelactone hydrolase